MSQDDVETLQAWKDSALAVMAGWDEVCALIPKEFQEARLGAQWSSIVAEYIRSLSGPPAVGEDGPRKRCGGGCGNCQR